MSGPQDRNGFDQPPRLVQHLMHDRIIAGEKV
ncbi:hypothetical protein IWQ48_004098 [Labrenzia sp. EL_13]|nr:hypothetical protein [Labrenzia sp. EL_13]